MTEFDYTQSTAPDTINSQKNSSRKRKMGAMALAAVFLIGATYEGYHWLTFGRYEISTDDAYVQADMTTLAAKVSGYIVKVEVEDHQEVQQGDIIARIDDGDYRLTVKAAEGRIATQEATINRINEQIKVADTAISQARAQVSAASVEVDRSSKDFERQDKLASSNFASQSALDNARAARDRAIANLSSAEAGLVSAQANLGVVRAQQIEAQRNLAEFKTNLAKAQRDLDFTVIRAPIAGVIGNKALEVGKLVSVGQRLAVVVPLSEVYIKANFKETQLDRLNPGQSVNITVDTYPGKVFPGTVESIAPASGALFSLLPPENATGNFTKIVQRVPVKISLPQDVLVEHLLRVGLSVVVSVDTRKAPISQSDVN